MENFHGFKKTGFLDVVYIIFFSPNGPVALYLNIFVRMYFAQFYKSPQKGSRGLWRQEF